ncbi:chemotaxis protein methyltransferase CheR [Caldimonas brevitalea]|uniref:histidine kinase n=1 Tax=Caldimonas brevitalea TaxID=413882 RepID=A0A0G3BR76_9BURK|nr:chemotaxis protein methyltransferase CheR [Caldimonas brevitalea]
MFEATPASCLVVAPDFHIVAVTDAYLAATSRVRAELLGRHIFDAFPDNPDDPASSGVKNLRSSLERVLRDGVRDTMAIQKYDIPVVDDETFEERYWSPVNTPVFDAQGRLTHVIHRVEDVTEIVLAENQALADAATIAAQAVEIRAANQSLRDSEQQALEIARQAEAERQRLDAVLDAAPVGILVADRDGRIVRTNPANAEIWGVPRPQPGDVFAEVVSQGQWADGSPRQGEPLQADEWPLARALRGERARAMIEVTLAGAAPERRTVLASAAPIVDTQGRAVGAVAAVMDVSERVRAEQALREADRRKDEFLAMLAHELRNPLAPISSAAALLAMGRLDHEQVRRMSEIVERQARHLAGLVDDLLDVSRITRGLITLDMALHDGTRVLQEAVEQVRPLLEARQHRLTVQMPSDPVQLIGDRKRVVQVLTNLLTNAAKYTPPEGDISVVMVTDGAQLVINVTDNGIGMEREFLTSAFDLFSQAHHTADRSQGGLGIGLAVVKRLVELHGGSVAVHSDGPGQGSRFTVRLPLVQALDERGGRGPAPAPGVPSARSLKVMVVDDNVDAAGTLGMLVEALGHRVTVECGPRKALKQAEHEDVDVFLLDLGLPDIDGFELARRLRSHPRSAGAALVAVSGYGQAQDKICALEAGFDYHLVKPADPGELERVLAEISLRRGEPAPHRPTF